MAAIRLHFFFSPLVKLFENKKIVQLTLKVMLSANSVSQESGDELSLIPSVMLDHPVTGRIHSRLRVHAAAIMRKARFFVRLLRYLSGDVIDQ